MQACNTMTYFPPGLCGERTDTVSGQTQTGTFVFGSDGIATQMVRTAGTVTQVTPASCLGSATQTCADLDAALQANVQAGTGWKSGSCADSADDCVCTAMFETDTNVSGPYATSGSTVTGSGNSTLSYCVTGSTLILSSTNTTGDPPVVYVLARQ